MRIFSSVFLFLLFAASFLPAQQYNLRTWTVGDGLPQSQVYHICEDHRGYLWFGTRGGGICRFDGVHFETFTERNGLAGMYISMIHEAPDGKIWIGTDGGLSIFDGNSLRLRGKKGLEIRDMIWLDDEHYWLATSEGIAVGVKGNPDWEWLRKSGGLPDNSVNCFERTPDGRIWTGTEKGIAILTAINGVPDTTVKHEFLGTSDGLANSEVRALKADRNMRVWICHYGGGVSYAQLGKENSVMDIRRLTVRDGLPNNVVVSVMEDRKGNIWFGTMNGGAARYDGRIFNYFNESVGLYSNHIRTIHEDKWGNVWFGTSGGGVSRFAGEDFVHYRETDGLPGNRVYAISEDTSGNFWLGTSAGGIAVFDGLEMKNIGSDSGFTDQIVKAIYHDSGGNMWIGTEGMGLWRHTPEGFVQFGPGDGLQGLWVRDILQTSDGSIWVATAGGGLSRYQKGTFTTFTERHGLPGNRINCLESNSEGMLWIGTEKGGLAWYNGKKFGKLPEGLPGICSPEIRSLLWKDAILWAATSEGLMKLNAGEESWKAGCIGLTEGLSSSNLYLLASDLEGNIWAGSERGVDRISFTRKESVREIRHFGKTEGFTGVETCRDAWWIDRKGQIWFGTVNGLTRMRPHRREENQRPPLVHLTTVRLFYEDINESEYGKDSLDWFGVPRNLELPHNYNHLGFEFTGIDHNNPGKLRFHWRLTGFEENWSPEKDKREATYSNLPPGEYRFEVEAVNEFGTWSPEKVSFEFVILPPWWSTWWFRGSVGLVLLLTLFSFIRMREKQIKRKSQRYELENKMLELEQKALRLQMNPHFIFNALNSIKGCIAQEQTALAKQNLVRFARLMRLNLDNSRSSYVSLAKEIESLELYVELEQISRSGKIEYKIDSEEIDREHLEIPPMIIQPFVENAIIHGIAPSDRPGKLEIGFIRKENELICTVRDNGIGRVESEKRREGREQLHQSSGLKVTRERLSMMLNKSADEVIRFGDDEDGHGTLVEIHLPYKTVY